MMRGVYAAAVDALEGVIEFCSTGTEVGGTVFLELGMAYEAAGMRPEAKTVYAQLAQTGRSKVKSDARRLLFNAEAMEFMKDDGDLGVSTVKEARESNYIDTSVLSRLSDYDDKSYATAYVDTSGGRLKSLLKNGGKEFNVRTCGDALRVLLECDVE